MDILIVGSVALDDVRTPFGEVKHALGGSAVYASLAASTFASTGIVGVVGADFPAEHVRLLKDHHIGLAGLQTAPGKTFHWEGYYEYDLSSAHTVTTELNVFAQFVPQVPPAYRSAPFVFLANIDPELQAKVLSEVERPKFSLLDTMNYWIETKREALLAVLRRVDMVVVNDAEARQLSGVANLMQAARWIRQHGPKGVIIKKGEHGALVFWEDQISILPAYPLEAVKDPTGAGDTFAGGFIGALARQGQVNPTSLRTAAAAGTVLSSFTVEDFSVRRLAGLKTPEILARHTALCDLTRLEKLPLPMERV